jgi:hypothetical protein
MPQLFARALVLLGAMSGLAAHALYDDHFTTLVNFNGSNAATAVRVSGTGH